MYLSAQWFENNGVCFHFTKAVKGYDILEELEYIK